MNEFNFMIHHTLDCYGLAYKVAINEVILGEFNSLIEAEEYTYSNEAQALAIHLKGEGNNDV